MCLRTNDGTNNVRETGKIALEVHFNVKMSRMVLPDALL